jgi:predicted transposase/invertase (TIGR01784 family)
MASHEAWAAFFQYLTDRSKRGKINEILHKEEGIAMASEVLIDITQEDIEWARKLSREKYILDTHSHRTHAWRTGLAKGKAKGQETATLNIARNALAEGATPEFVQKITGLDLETINQLITNK